MEVLRGLITAYADRDDSALNDEEKLKLAKDLRVIGNNYGASSLLLIAEMYT